MTKIKENDFIELEYTGKLQDSGEVFDTTDETIAKDNGLYEDNSDYEPVVICVGHGHLIRGVDEQIVGKKPGKSYSMEVEPEKAFGKKRPDLLKLMAAAAFKKQNIAPQPGLQVSVDGTVGVVRSVTGGRVVVDFNHPLAGKTLEYDITVNRVVKEEEEQAEALVKLLLGQRPQEVKKEETELKILMEDEVPEKAAEMLSKEIQELIGLPATFQVKGESSPSKEKNEKEVKKQAKKSKNKETTKNKKSKKEAGKGKKKASGKKE